MVSNIINCNFLSILHYNKFFWYVVIQTAWFKFYFSTFLFCGLNCFLLSFYCLLIYFYLILCWPIISLFHIYIRSDHALSIELDHIFQIYFDIIYELAYTINQVYDDFIINFLSSNIFN